MGYAPFDLSGKVALITGGNGGIGLGMAEALAQAGADIAIWGTNEEKNAAATEKLTAHGVKAVSMLVDVSDEARVNEATAEVVAKLGRIDTCVANAGIAVYPGKFNAFDTAAYRKVLSVNLDGLFFTLRAAADHMVDRAGAGDPGGSLVGISSVSAISGAPRNQPYAATKGAVIAAMKGIAVEFARYGIIANTVLPGWIMTDMAAPMLEAENFEDKVLPRVPAGRWGAPEDLGGIAVYLSSSAARYHTGQEFVICGGYTIF